MLIMKTYKAVSNLIQKVFITAQKESVNEMGPEGTFNIIRDTGASISISPNKKDFVDFKKIMDSSFRAGVSKRLKVEGEGIVQWNMIDANGNIRKLQISALYVPSCNLTLLRPDSITKMYPDESISFIESGIALSGSIKATTRVPIMTELSKSNYLPFTTCLANEGLHKAGMALNTTITSVHESNLNLIASPKYYLQFSSQVCRLYVW